MVFGREHEVWQSPAAADVTHRELCPNSCVEARRYRRWSVHGPVKDTVFRLDHHEALDARRHVRRPRRTPVDVPRPPSFSGLRRGPGHMAIVADRCDRDWFDLLQQRRLRPVRRREHPGLTLRAREWAVLRPREWQPSGVVTAPAIDLEAAGRVHSARHPAIYDVGASPDARAVQELAD